MARSRSHAQLTRPAQHDAIAVIGMSCRLPRAADLAAFWKLLIQGSSAVTEVPDGRWDLDAGSTGTDAADTGSTDTGSTDGDAAGRRAALRYGAFLDQVDAFDGPFFGVSLREALAMDPQQRLMLELGWEALEHGGIVPATLRGSRTGVFVGAMSSDYAEMLRQDTTHAVTQHSFAGTQRGIIANRLSYTLGLNGPSMTVDAAQASSLVAVHLAVESLRRGESELALAGGVNLNLSAAGAQTVAGFGGLSPDGQCYTFDARANGFVRGEGGGLVLLKPLAKALADGDVVHAVIRGTAVNNDGATDGLTVPSTQAQADVLRQACQDADVDPARIQYVELHGTGTRVGDPIEAAGVGQAFGTDPDRHGTPLRVGSVKTNIGHLEAAAGIAGLLKVVLSLRQRQLPASLNFATPNAGIDLDALNLQVQRELGGWPQPEQLLLAGVSSFGMGGTNCHVILAEPPASGVQPQDRTAYSDASALPLPWLVSGRSEAALRAQAERLRTFAANDAELSPADVAWSLAAVRTAFEHRAVVLGTDSADLLRGLDALAAGEPAADVVRGSLRGSGALAFQFTGQGSQYPGMGRELYDA